MIIEKESNHNREQDESAGYQSAIDLLNYEINHLNDQQGRPGWTKWAIVAAFASLLWLLINVMESSQVNWKIASIYTVFLYLFAIGVKSTLNIMTLTPEVTNEIRFSKIVKKIHPNECLWSIAKSTVMLLFLWYANVYFSLAETISLSIFISLGIVFSAIAIVIIQANIPMNITGKKSSGWLSFVLDVFCIYPIIMMAVIVIRTNLNTHLPEIRVSGIIFGLVFLVDKYLEDTPHGHMLAELINIRRQLCMRKINSNAAIQQTEIVILGMKISDLLSGDVSRILSLFRNFEDILNMSREEAISVKSKLSSLESPSDEDKILVRAVRESLANHGKRIQKIGGEMEEVVNKFKKRCMFYVGQNRGIMSDVEKIIEKIEDGIKGAKRTVEATEKEINCLYLMEDKLLSQKGYS